MNPRRSTKLQNAIQSGIHADADGCTVLRFGQRLARRDRALVPVFRHFRSPFTEDSSSATDHDRAVIQRRIFHHRSRIHSVFKRGCVNERQHGRSYRTFGLQRAVVLIVLEIAAPH